MHVQSFRAAFVLGLLGWGSVSLPACSDDSEATPPPTAGTGGTAAGASGTGGAGGSTGGNAGSDAGPPTTTCGTQTCTGIAAVPPLLNEPVMPCCTGPAGDRCGIDGAMFQMGCVEKDQPGNPDSTCFANPGAGGAGGAGGSAGSGGAAGEDAGDTDADTTDGGTTDAGEAGAGGSAGAAGASGSAGAVGAGGSGAVGGGPSFGCCKPNGVCGILIDFPGFELGCVDITQFDGGPAPQSCTPSN